MNEKNTLAMELTLEQVKLLKRLVRSEKTNVLLQNGKREELDALDELETKLWAAKLVLTL